MRFIAYKIFFSRQLFYGWWVVLACFFIGLYISGITFYGFTAFIEPLKKEFGWSYAQISFAASLRGLEMGIFAPVIGFFIDRLGPRKVIVCGLIAVCAGFFLMSFAQSLLMFYGAFVLISFGAGGCTSLVTISLAANWFHKDVGKAIGIAVSGMGASGLMIPLIVLLIESCGWRNAVIILALGAVIIGFPFLSVIRNRPEECGLFPDGKEPIADASGNQTESADPAILWRDAIKRKAFLLLNFAEFVRMMAVSALATHVMPYLSSIGLSRSIAGFVAASIPLCSIIGRVSFGWLGDIFEKRWVMVFTFAFMSLGMLAFSQAHIFAFLILFLFIFPPSYGGATVLRGSILREYFGRSSFGKMLGIIMGSASIGGIVGPTLAGWVFDTVGTYFIIWVFFSILIFIMAVATIQIKP